MKLNYSKNVASSFFQKIRSTFCARYFLSTPSAKIETLSSDVNVFVKHVMNDVK